MAKNNVKKYNYFIEVVEDEGEGIELYEEATRKTINHIREGASAFGKILHEGIWEYANGNWKIKEYWK